jgi:hypothetical protein
MDWWDWWDNLQPGQGALLGGLAVLVAGILAFTTGWFERRATQRRFHYEEVRRVYSDALKLASEVSNLHLILATDEQREDRLTANSAKFAAMMGDLDLIGDYETAQLLARYLFQELMHGLTSRNSEAVAPREPGYITNTQVMQQVRKALARYVPYSSHHARTLRKPITSKGEDVQRILEERATTPAPEDNSGPGASNG